MTNADIPQVLEVDRESYPLPWPASAYRRELVNNSNARYIVLREFLPDDVEQPLSPVEERKSWRNLLTWPRAGRSDGKSPGRVNGYAGMWVIADEAHITTIAVRTANRGSGFGELLLASLIAIAFDIGIRWVTLEVRVTNHIAKSLYRKYGFRDAGIRRYYYSDNNEDALIMTTDDITLNAYQAQFDAMKNTLLTRLNSPPAIETLAPMLAGGRVR